MTRPKQERKNGLVDGLRLFQQQQLAARNLKYQETAEEQNARSENEWAGVLMWIALMMGMIRTTPDMPIPAFI